jgi:hypothetical protein
MFTNALFRFENGQPFNIIQYKCLITLLNVTIIIIIK